jgi:sterol 3beta-glucosyltransferase
MKIAITTVGTRGDLQPYIALGLGLKNSGHEVIIVSAKNEESFVRNYGLDFYALDVDIQKIMESGDVQEMAKGSTPLKFIISHLKGSKSLKELMVKTQGEIWNACQNSDLIIFHPGMPLGLFLAKEQNKKAILATPFPVVATKDYPSILFYALPKLGSYYNLLTHFIFDKVFWALAKSPIKEFWTNSIKSKANFDISPLKQQIKNGGLVLNGYSELLFKQSKQWTNNIHTTGSWIIETEPNFLPTKELEDFIFNGETPIYIGFGSMKDPDTFNKTLAIIIETLSITNQRAIVGLGWTKNDYKETLPENVFLVDSVPHTWLFPKMKIVIHHGGAGTTATGLRAGKPTIIIPHNADQPAWGKKVFELGVGSKPIKKSKLTADKLATAILYSLTPNIINNAEQLGKKLRHENGVQKATQIIEKFISEENGSS